MKLNILLFSLFFCIKTESMDLQKCYDEKLSNQLLKQITMIEIPNKDIIKHLLQTRADPNIKTIITDNTVAHSVLKKYYLFKEQTGPSAYSAANSLESILDLFLEFKADISLQDSFGNTLLHTTVRHYDVTLFKKLITPLENIESFFKAATTLLLIKKYCPKKTISSIPKPVLYLILNNNNSGIIFPNQRKKYPNIQSIINKKNIQEETVVAMIEKLLKENSTNLQNKDRKKICIARRHIKKLNEIKKLCI